MKVSHVDTLVVYAMVTWIRHHYEQDGIRIMKVTHGTTHNFLGMTLHFNQKESSVTIDMSDYVNDLVDEFPDPKTSMKELTPESYVLFTVRTTIHPLSQPKAVLYHRFVAKRLYLEKR